MKDVLARQPTPPQARLTLVSHPKPSAGQALLEQLLGSSVILAEDWEQLAAETRERLTGCEARDELLPLLVEHGLLTEYQAARVYAGKTYGLLLGNYRVVDRLGSGGMGVVFKGEHLYLRKQVAIKVLASPHERDPLVLQRFYTEMRMIAHLQHPNIVAAIDGGQVAELDEPTLHYYVMEYVPGQDLEQSVLAKGPLPAAEACDLIHQIASALVEAHRHSLVHRDIKPPNIRVTPEGQAKLLDFGLVRHFRTHRLTQVGTVLGTLDYIAPEQIQNPSAVDIRADLYSLGGTLFWCLTGRLPFPQTGSVIEEVAQRRVTPPPCARRWQPEVPRELDAVLARMMATDPNDRYATPQDVTRALLPFLKPELRDNHLLTAGQAEALHRSVNSPGPAGTHEVLVVDDEPGIRLFCRRVLQAEGLACDEAPNGARALEMLRARRYDLVLLDIDMPELTGPELCQELRARPPCQHLKIIMFSGRSSSDEMAKMLLAGADDYLSKPLSVIQLQARIQSALRLKDAQDRADRLNQHLLAVNEELEKHLQAQAGDLVHARDAVVLALAKLVEHRDTETGAHLLRLQRYSRSLAEEAAAGPPFAEQIDVHFVEMLVSCAPLHDIGKVGLPDHLLLKPGRLDPDERILMQAHTIIGAETLQEVARHHGSALAFLQMAIDIARHHHERWDGTGYPDRLAGSAIPLAARIVALGDVYDALRCRRVYKPALSHSASVQLMREASQGQFDPALLEVFQRCAPQWERIFSDLRD